MKLVRWALLALLVGAAAAFAAELMRPRTNVAGSSGYRAPLPSADHRAVRRETV